MTIDLIEEMTPRLEQKWNDWFLFETPVWGWNWRLAKKSYLRERRKDDAK
jgi:hypothetical protein